MNQRISTFFYSMDGIGGKNVQLESLEALAAENSAEYKSITALLDKTEFSPSEASVQRILDFAKQFCAEE